MIKHYYSRIDAWFRTPVEERHTRLTVTLESLFCLVVSLHLCGII